MARTIYGKVTDQNGKAVKDVKIEAWDDDWPDSDDRMGVTYTNSSGNYELHYRGGPWDPKYPGSTSWRPDIYVTASLKNANGRWMHAAKSRTYKNHKLRKDKKIDLKVRIQPVQTRRIAFDFSKCAFKFDNRFSIRDIIPAFPGDWSMGLCGGMSAGALHRHNHGCGPAPETNPPASGTPLFGELLQRQIDTLSTAMLAKIVTWTRSPDVPHMHTITSLRQRQKGEWPTLKFHIDKGRPVILCVILEEGYLADISGNHQVLAYGYEYHPTTRDLKVEIYDPNDQNGPNFIHLCLSGGRLGAHQFDSAGARSNLRAFFVMDTSAEAAKKHY